MTDGQVAGHVVLAAYGEGARVETGRGPAAWGGDQVREVVYFSAPA